MVYKRRK